MIWGDAAATNGFFTPVTPTNYARLSFLTSSANGGHTLRIVVSHADGTKESSPPIPAGERGTRWSLKVELKAGAHYAWRVRAIEGNWKGPECRAVFIVKG